MDAYTQLVTALKATGIPFAEGVWSHAPSGHYGLIAVDGTGGSLPSNNRKACRALEATVDLFTPTLAQTDPQLIEAVLDQDDNVAWRLSSVQVERDATPQPLCHYEWIVQILEVSAP